MNTRGLKVYFPHQETMFRAPRGLGSSESSESLQRAGETSTCCIYILDFPIYKNYGYCTYPNPTEINLAQPTIRNYGLMLISHPQNVKNPAIRNHDLMLMS